LTIDANGKVTLPGHVSGTLGTDTAGNVVTNAHAVNVKLYGAKGDDATDDTVTIQNALNTGVDVFFPAGTYIVSASLTLPSGGRRVYGAGIDITTIKFAASGSLTMFDHTLQHDLTLSDFTIDAHNNSACILFKSCFHAKVHRVKCKNTAASAISYSQAGGAASHWGEVVGCHFDNIGNHAVYVSLSDSFRMIGCFGTGIGYSGVDIAGGQRAIIANNEFRGLFAPANGSGFGGIRLSNQAYFCSVTGNIVSGFSRGLMIIGAVYSTITGNVFSECNVQGMLISAAALGGGVNANFNTISANTLVNIGLTYSFEFEGTDLNPNYHIPQAGVLLIKESSCNTTGNIILGNTIVQNNLAYMSQALENDTGQPNTFSTNTTNHAVLGP